MADITFSLPDYQDGIRNRQYRPPRVMSPYYEVDPQRYVNLGRQIKGRGTLAEAMQQLQRRMPWKYFSKALPLQAKTLGYSRGAFPPYTFILPEVMTEDWLGIVDWGKYQRDHVLHLPLCGYIMLKLLGDEKAPGLLGGNKILDLAVKYALESPSTSYLRDFLFRCGMDKEHWLLNSKDWRARKVWADIIREAAYIAAVFHDLGYPWQYAQKIESHLDGINASAIKQGHNTNKLIERFEERLFFRALSGYQLPAATTPSTWHSQLSVVIDASLKKTHGLLGTLGFLHLNDSVRRFPLLGEDPLKMLCVEWAATAIMMHDMSKIYWGNGSKKYDVPENRFLRVSFEKDPVSALVTLVDLLQDFERPAAYFTSEKERVSANFDPACTSTTISVDDDGTMHIKYKMKGKDQLATKRKMLFNEQREFFDAQNGYLDLSAMGISRVVMYAE